MTFPPFARALAAAMLLAAPAAAFDITAMTEAERAAFGEAVRAYLLENPEVLFEAGERYQEKFYEEQARLDAAQLQSAAEDLFHAPHSWVGGNPDGSVTLVLFNDYKCPYCRQAHQMAQQLLAADDDIRFVIKEFPILGEESVLAGRFTIAVLQKAGAEAYAKVNDALFNFRGTVSPKSLEQLANTLGLDGQAILAHMSSEEVSTVLKANYELAERLQIESTPGFVLPDKMIRGYVPAAVMQEYVDATRANLSAQNQ